MRATASTTTCVKDSGAGVPCAAARKVLDICCTMQRGRAGLRAVGGEPRAKSDAGGSAARVAVQMAAASAGRMAFVGGHLHFARFGGSPIPFSPAAPSAGNAHGDGAARRMARCSLSRARRAETESETAARHGARAGTSCRPPPVPESPRPAPATGGAEAERASPVISCWRISAL